MKLSTRLATFPDVFIFLRGSFTNRLIRPAVNGLRSYVL